MTFDLARLAILDQLFLVNEAIGLVKLALNDGPTPQQALDLAETRSDLEMLKAELTARHTQLVAGAVNIPSPSEPAMQQIQVLTQKVQQAKINGTSAQARMAVVSQVLGLAITVAS